MALPDSVQKSIDKAAADHAAAYGGEAPADPNAAPVIEVVDAVPGQEPPAPAAEAPPAPPAEPATPPAEPVAPSDDDDPKWKARYQALQGKYNKEIPRLNDENKELKGRLDGLESIMAGMQATAPAAPAPTVTDQAFVDEYGQEMADAVASMVDSRTAELRSDNQKLTDRLNQQDTLSQQTAEQDFEDGRAKMMDALTEKVPDWPELNVNQDFLTWLGQTDVPSGNIRQENLDNALAGLKTATVIAIFEAYKQENAGITPPSAPTTPQPLVSKETLVAPGQVSSGSDRAPEGNNKRTWTQAQIAQFYNEVTAGKWAGREAEKLATEQDIIAASGDGRIIS